MTRKNPIGYTVCMYQEGGGCVAFWRESLDDALQEIKDWKTPHDGYIIVKLPFSKRMGRYVIQKPKNLNDSGIYSRKQEITHG